MIFVTVGTHPQSFDRLIKAVDDLVNKNKIKEKVIMQIGNTKYKPKNYKWKNFFSPKEFIEMNKKAEIIITHGGEGCVATALQLNKLTIVVPRLKKFKEHVNDHQLDLTRALEEEKRIIAVYDIKNLENALKKAKNFKVKKTWKEKQIIQIIEEFLNAT